MLIFGGPRKNWECLSKHSQAKRFNINGLIKFSRTFSLMHSALEKIYKFCTSSFL